MLYIPSQFEASDTQAFSLITRHPLATLVCLGGDFPVTHMPMYLNDDQTQLVGHFAGANPHPAAARKHRHLAIFTGAAAYISASWYPDPEQVPTWNYQSVHVSGELRLIEDTQEKLAIVDRLTEIHEMPMSNPWNTSKMSEQKKNQMLAHITGCALRIEKIEAKFKLSQNKAHDKNNILKGLARQPGTGAMIAAMTENERP